MRLKEATPEVLSRLRARLQLLEGLRIERCFQSPNFPHLNSSTSGSVQTQSTPNWYTHIHDALENELVEYTREDIQHQRFFEIKMVLIPDYLLVYLLEEKSPNPVIQLSLGVKVDDLRRGTFQFTKPLEQRLFLYDTNQMNRSIA